MEDEVIVKGGEFNLRRSDLEFLKGPCFITDRLIDSYFAAFWTTFQLEEVAVVPSSITYWIAHAEEDSYYIGNFVYQLDLSWKKMVLFPVNNDKDFDRIDVRPETHWSLLVYDSFKNAFIHFEDVLEDPNDSNDILASKIYDYFKTKGPGMLINPEEVKTSEYRKVSMADPAKGFYKYDCGVHVISMVEIICEWFLHYRKSDKDHRGYERWIQEMEASEESTTREVIKYAIHKVTNNKDIMELLGEVKK